MKPAPETAVGGASSNPRSGGMGSAYNTNTEVSMSPSRDHRPPINEIFIQEMPQREDEAPTATTTRSNFCQPYPSPARVSQASVTTDEESRGWNPSPGQRGTIASSVSSTEAGLNNSFSSFKLRPRHPISAFGYSSPPEAGFYPSYASVRGRKRPAQSISSGGAPDSTGNSSSDGTPPRHSNKGRSRLHGDFSPRPPRFESEDASTSTCLDSPSVRDSKMAASTYDDLDILGMQGLSLHSPVCRAQSFDSHSPLSRMAGQQQQQQSRSRASSFSLYNNSSPAGSVARGESVSGSSIFRASGSAKSSPRHVPVTIISGTKPVAESPSKASVGGNRPPLYVGTSLLYSLDGSKESDDEGPDLAGKTPGVATAPSSASSISSNSDSPRRHANASFAFESPDRQSLPTPKATLPRITLTPRTPGSAAASRKSSLPVFPSPLSEDEPEGFRLESPERIPRQRRDVDKRSEEAMDQLLYGFINPRRLEAATSPMRCDTETEVRAASGPPLKTLHPLSSSSLAFSMDDEEVANNGVSRPPVPHVGPRRNGFLDIKPAAKPRSILAPSTSGGMRKALFESGAVAGIMDAETGSLTDSDDEDQFVLSCPTTKADPTTDDACDSSVRKAKHQRCCSNDDQPSFGLYWHPSATSLASGLAASNTSLFGMDILHEEGPRSSTPRPTTPFSGTHSRRRSSGNLSRLRRRESDDALQSRGLRRGMSEHSLGSIGLSLDAVHVDDTGRELVTPPVTSSQNRALSPPPLPPRMGNRSQHIYDSPEESDAFGGVRWLQPQSAGS